ncbi:MAG: alpha/beta hydrolase [Clostridiales bacterium]|nr:alpha/beta hydrolase [Clostridiales bacterium]
MIESLEFDQEKYQIRTMEQNGHKITFREYKGIPYCKYPVESIQKLNLFVPEEFYEDKSVGEYQLRTAPIFVTNTVGEYRPGPADEPRVNEKGNINSIFAALEHGYVVVSVGVRGCTTRTGKAPALIVDMKAAIRYLRHNKEKIPGNTEWIVTNGTSAGGALSALTGATGNSPDYKIYLKKIGAAEERDDVYAASCYCPIQNLEHADAAYEWMFGSEQEYHSRKSVLQETDNEIIMEMENEGRLNEKQTELSRILKNQFQAYVNHLRLTDGRGNWLQLDENGEGNFKDYVQSYVEWSAQDELDTHHFGSGFPDLVVEGSDVDNQSYMEVRGGKLTAFHWDGFIKKVTRMKKTPAFDSLDLTSPENEEFGSENTDRRHFTELSKKFSEKDGEMVEAFVVKRMNPMRYIGKADTAKHWRIRHGVFDRATALAMPIILATKLMDKGYDVDFYLPWGISHGGDYDLDELFAWIDRICLEQPQLCFT